MKQFKLKKLIAALQAGAMTTLVCASLPSHASDTELYKAPQSSQTTLMFMLDVSGSMNDYDGVGSSRLDRLKDGMTKLLQGDANTEALPDRLVTGLATFDRYTGRIKLEAKPLGDETLILNAPVYREVQPKTGTATQAVYSKVVEQGQYYDDGDRYWTNYELIISEYQGGIINSALVNTGTKSFEECIGWDASKNCTQWLATTKSLSDFGTVISNMTNINETTSSLSSGTSTQIPITKNRECVSYRGNGSCRTWRNYQNVKQITYVGPRTGTVALDQVTTYAGTAKDTHRKKMLRQVRALQLGGATPTAFAYAEAAAYMMGQTTRGEVSSGFNESTGLSLIQNGVNYLAPESVSNRKQCNTQGIYFLTDGEPNYNNNNGNYTTFMQKTLGTKGSGFSCNTNQLVTTGNSWGCIGNYAKTLLDTAKNPAGVTIKTAVVGFGSDFNGASTNSDVVNAKKWGEVGQGGWYSGASAADVVNSVKAFLKKLQKYIPPVTTGSATIPLDNLDPQNIQPWAYFPQFDPAPDAQVTTWVGNLKKYASSSNQLFDRDSQPIMNSTTGVSVDDPNDYWADTAIKKKIIKVVTENGQDVDKEIEVRVGGALSQLRLANATNERNLYTDRKMALANDNSTYVPQPLTDAELVKFGTSDLKTNNASNNLDKDPKRGYLAALLGYNVTNDMAGGLTQASNSIFNSYLVPANSTLRQMGAVMHSKPIMLTQEGTTEFNDKTGQLEYVNRDDLIVFGTTQGVLHVVKAGKSATDADAGKEVFAFVPSEMVDNQPQAFLDQQYQGRTLQYGIDGQWTTHTEYVSKYINKDDKTPTVTVKGGKQTLYGGLRMGGKSYYALDLSTVTSDPITSGKPKIKFKISPSGTCAANNPLGCMGQSWSKPSIGWVNWKGQRKLVMFVGGGYDERYESTSDYSSSGTDKGAGVYMFDAENGALLWWASSNVATDTNSNEETYVSNMTKSVVSQIKTIDRNSDGLIDHLYFGDLGGQLWRVDINSALKAGMSTTGTGDDQVIGQTFAKHVTRVLNMSGATAPRFYTTPTFTVHNGTGGLFGVVSIGSGNASFPMSSAANTNEGLYVIYDKDVAKRNLLVMASDALTTVDVSTSGEGSKKLVQNADGNTATEYANGGWYYPFTSKKKVLNDTAAVDSDLYVSVFDANVDIADVDCFGGVRGQSKVSQFCLPYGECRILSGTVYITQERPNDIFLGKGNIGISFGGQGKDRGLVLNLPSSGPFKTYNGKTQFISQRWYER
ncbi:MAG: PilC/PilY family type IV pilus protein [Acinetobacter sp.]